MTTESRQDAIQGLRDEIARARAHQAVYALRPEFGPGGLLEEFYDEWVASTDRGEALLRDLRDAP